MWLGDNRSSYDAVWSHVSNHKVRWLRQTDLTWWGQLSLVKADSVSHRALPYQPLRVFYSTRLSASGENGSHYDFLPLGPTSAHVNSLDVKLTSLFKSLNRLNILYLVCGIPTRHLLRADFVGGSDVMRGTLVTYSWPIY